jgi:ATP-dependent exoDNAse (exonuclease V) beta subunit
MPVLIVDPAGIYDTAGIVPDQPPSSPIEQERRLFYVAITRAIDHLCVGTIIPPEAGLQLASSSALPSRFLEEWQHEQSKPILAALQAAYASKERKDWQARSALEQVLTQQAEHRRVVSYVVEHYLSRLDDPAMIDRVRHALETVPERRFEYTYQYPEFGVPRKPAEKQIEPPPWVDPWDGIGITI